MANSGKKESAREEFEGLQVWKVVGIFAMVFLAVQLAVAFFGISFNAVMRWLGAGENARVFIGSTFSRTGMIAAVILICAPVIRKVFCEDTRALLFPISPGWFRDMAIGILLSGGVMALAFGVLLATGQITLEGLALGGQPPDAWLRAIWLALLVNAAATVGEEVLFRGLLLTGLRKSWDTGGAVFISAVIFGASHILTAASRQTNWLEFIPLLALPGAMLGWAFLRTGNLWLASGIHFGWTLFQHDIFNLVAREVSDSLFGWVTIHKGPAWLLGNHYGIEAGLAGVISLLLVSAGIWFFTKNRHTLAEQSSPTVDTST
jgi:hypothetical protein